MLTKSIIDCHKSLSTPIIITFPLSTTFLPSRDNEFIVPRSSTYLHLRTPFETPLFSLPFFPSPSTPFPGHCISPRMMRIPECSREHCLEIRG